VSEFRFKPHSLKQEELIFSDHELTIGATGTQWGKSQAGSLWMKRKIHLHPQENTNFILGAPTYKIMNQSMVPYFLHVMKDLGNYNKSEGVFELRERRRIYFRTETDPDSIVGIPNVKAGWLDEAGKLRLYFWQNYLARVASKGADTLLTTSPYSLNWLYRSYIKPYLAGEMRELDMLLIQAASWENPFHSLFDPENRKKLRAQMDTRRFDMLFGGEWSKYAGLVYDCWDDDRNLIDMIPLPTGTIYYAGVDWGFTDPFVFKVRAVTPDGMHYGVSEFYKTGLTISDQIAVAKQKKSVFGIKTFFCDPSRPDSIEEFCRAGLSAVPAQNDIRLGIDTHYELIKTGRYKEFRGACPNSCDERETYHYPEEKDLKADQNSKDHLPVDQYNHAMDVDRYLTLMTYRARDLASPKVPDETKKVLTQEQRLDRIRRVRNNSGSETWSRES
jgi:PBSX family phage terminase large subunit